MGSLEWPSYLTTVVLFHDIQNSCCSLLQCAAMCYNVLHVAVNSPGKPGMAILFDDSRNSMLQCVAVNSLGDPFCLITA